MNGTEAKPWRAALARAINQDTINTLHLPLMVESFGAAIRQYAALLLVSSLGKPRTLLHASSSAKLLSLRRGRQDSRPLKHLHVFVGGVPLVQYRRAANDRSNLV